MAKTWQVILATVAIFVAGLVAGGASAFGFMRWATRHPRYNPAQMAPYAWRQGQVQPLSPQLMRSFANQLDLTPMQRARILPIVRRTAGQLGRDRREVQLSAALSIERMQDEISAVLTPDQRAKFEELIGKQRARLQELRRNAQQPPPPEGPPPPAK
jgi:Spy/CpxP family protein refolding chaperone